ncbi:cytochrome P450 [Xylariaceae sp. FL1651]|nr:cytochrome P450 [Xylariaceae sp. FL1651]
MHSYLQLAVAAALMVLLYVLARCIYLLVFHPLAKYPGLKLAALTEYWYAFSWASGNYPHIMYAAHEKHGTVIRTGPNKLSFATVQAHHDIYGHKPLFRKSEWYTGGLPGGIVFERDPIEHAHIRKALSPKSSILDLTKTIPKLVAGFHEDEKSQTVTIDVCRLFTMFTFDTIGMITMGKSFNSLSTNTLHPLAELMHMGAYAATLKPLRRRLWFFDQFIRLRSAEKDPAKLRAKHLAILRVEIEQCAALGTAIDGGDIATRVLRQQTLDENLLIANAVNLLIAGSETVATGLSNATFLLLQNEPCLQQLKSEIRGTFSSEMDITGDTTAKLPYLKAVIDETLRILPPSPFGQSRTSPGATVDGLYIPPGVDVSVDIWSLQHSARYWKDPWTFRPERWIKGEHDTADEKGGVEANLQDNKEAFQPFSEGPRACLGMGLTFLEMRIMLAKLVWLYDWELDSRSRDWLKGLKLNFMWRKPELLVRFSPRLD